MKIEKAIQMIDEYLLEPNNIDKAWVEVLELCKKTLLERDRQQAEIERLEGAGDEKELEIVKCNVIQKFAERFKSKASIQRDRVTGIPCYVISSYKLESIVKEMMAVVKNE